MNAGERRVGEVIELADTVFLDGAPGLVGGDLVAEQAREHLVNDGFTHGDFLAWLRAFDRRRCCLLSAAGGEENDRG